MVRDTLVDGLALGILDILVVRDILEVQDTLVVWLALGIQDILVVRDFWEGSDTWLEMGA